MSLEFNKIYNESNLETMKKMDSESVDVILTSPFYNTNHRAGKDKTLLNTHVKKPSYQYVRYDVFVDKMSNDEYIKYTKELFSGFDKVLKPRGVVLYNINYGADNPFGMFEVLNEVCREK
jgi:DNA modification methylase